MMVLMDIKPLKALILFFFLFTIVLKRLGYSIDTHLPVGYLCRTRNARLARDEPDWRFFLLN
jgi:hypothetical protein